VYVAEFTLHVESGHFAAAAELSLLHLFARADA